MKLKVLTFSLLILLQASITFAYYPLAPNPNITPGSICDQKDNHFEEYRYNERVPYCRRAVSFEQRLDIYRNYKIRKRSHHLFTIDHFIPLALGGDNSPENLWPEHKKIKRLRANLEVDLYIQLKEGLITQDEAIQVIVDTKMNPPIEVTAFENIFYTQEEIEQP